MIDYNIVKAYMDNHKAVKFKTKTEHGWIVPLEIKNESIVGKPFGTKENAEHCFSVSGFGILTVPIEDCNFNTQLDYQTNYYEIDRLLISMGYNI